MRLSTLIIVVCSLAACAVSSPPIRHIQLAAGSLTAATGDAPVVYLDAVSIPDYLLRDALLRRIDAYTVNYDQNNRWAEPLDLGIQRVVAAQLESRLDTRQVVAFPDIGSVPADWHLRVIVKRFEASERVATLDAEAHWVATDSSNSGDQIQEKRVVNFVQSLDLADDSAGAVAAALSALLSDFSNALVEPIGSR